MKISKINEHLQAYQIAVHNVIKQREVEYRHSIENKKLDRIQENRVQRAQRLGMDKGTNIDLDC